jgi:hypothetical protein
LPAARFPRASSANRLSEPEDHMPMKSKLILASLAATLLMATALGSASARVFSLTNRNYRIVWRPLEFIEPNARFGTVRCPVTLEGSFHSSTISKVENALMGYVSRATTAATSCTGGSLTIHQESLPWRVTYRGFTGMLPSITEIIFSLLGPSMTIHEAVFTCNVTVTNEHASFGRIFIEIMGGGGRELEYFAMDETLIPVTGCPANNIKFRTPNFLFGGGVSLLGTTTRIRLTLI